MHTEGVAHGPATLFLHCGVDQLRPAVDGLVGAVRPGHRERATCPGFVSIAPSAGNGGPRNYGNAFLPAVYQGTALGKAGGPAAEATIRNLANPPLSPRTSAGSFDLLQAAATPSSCGTTPATPSWRRSSPRTSWPGGCRATPRTCSTCRSETPRDASALRHRRAGDRQLRPAVPDGPPAVRGGRALRAGDLRRQHAPTRPGTSTRTCPSTPTTPAPSTGRSPACWPT